MKLALGTVQFGNKYGISNSSGTVPYNEVEKILLTAKDTGIKMLDTANDYGESETILGSIGVSEFEIISKLQILEGDSIDEGFIEEKITFTLKKLRINSLYGLLIHNVDSIKMENINKILDLLSIYKKRKIIKKIGISVYSPNIIDNLIGSHNFDIVQAPINIFDRQMNTDGRLDILKRKKIEVHARSIFLQGLLMMNSLDRPKYFKSWEKLFKAYDDWISKKNILPIEACLNYAFNINSIKRIVVGVQSVNELKQILNTSLDKNIEFPNEIQSKDPKLINPLNWKV